jgi:hypothetical protein
MVAEPGFVREAIVGQGVVGIRRPPPDGDPTNLGNAQGDAAIVAAEVGVEAGTRLQVQAARTGGTIGGLRAGGAQVPGAEQLEAGERRVELLDQAMGDRRQHVFEVQRGGHLEGHPLQRGEGGRVCTCGVGNDHVGCDLRLCRHHRSPVGTQAERSTRAPLDGASLSPSSEHATHGCSRMPTTRVEV